MTAEGGAGVAGAPDAPAGAPAGEALAAASADLERGLALLLSTGGGPKTLRQAEEAFTAVITRLWPGLRALGGEGRRLLASAFDHRARARLKGGHAQDADADFRLAVEVDPSYLPDPREISAKSLERFEKIRSACIAWVIFRTDPPGTTIEWNGRSLGEASTLPAETPVVAGWYLLRASAPCSEERRLEGSLEAGEKRTITVRLEPLGRDLLFTTRPAGFDLEVDGTAVGTTAPPPRAGAAEGTPAGSPEGGEEAGGALPSAPGAGAVPPGREAPAAEPGSADSGSATGFSSSRAFRPAITAGAPGATASRGPAVPCRS